MDPSSTTKIEHHTEGVDEQEEPATLLHLSSDAPVYDRTCSQSSLFLLHVQHLCVNPLNLLSTSKRPRHCSTKRRPPVVPPLTASYIRPLIASLRIVHCIQASALTSSPYNVCDAVSGPIGCCLRTYILNRPDRLIIWPSPLNPHSVCHLLHPSWTASPTGAPLQARVVPQSDTASSPRQWNQQPASYQRGFASHPPGANPDLANLTSRLRCAP